ncbi:MAG: ABC transporter permease [Actinobacteria bacterium]|nr:ABC transporter permease [Actinomycetota bacterium]
MTYIEQLKKVWAVCKKDMRIYFLKAPVLIFGVLFPIFLFMAFGIGRKISAPELLPGLISMALFFTAAAVVPLIAPWETRTRTLERLVSSPVLISTIVLGDITASFIFGLIVAFIPVIVGIAIGVSIKAVYFFIPGIIVASFCFSSLGSLMSTPPADTPSNINMITTVVKFPLVFISGIFMPVKDLPLWGRVLSYISPLTYLTDLVRYCINGENYFYIWIDFIALLIFSLFFYILAVKLHQRNIPRRI